MSKGHLFCFGLGYVAQELSKELILWEFSGTHRGEREFKENEYLFNDEGILDSSLLKDVTHILISIPPTEQGDLVYNCLYDTIKNLPQLEWLGYISSTSVYGDHGGDWVDENSETRANDFLGLNRLKAEKQWLSTKLPVNIIRMAGIYGPGRSVFDRIKIGNVAPIHKEGHFFSRIHIDDIVLILKKMLKDSSPGEIYNFADDFPCSQREIVQYAYHLLGKSEPEIIDFKDAKLSEAMLHYYMANKRISNHKVKKRYNLELKNPDYKKGLASIFHEGMKYT